VSSKKQIRGFRLQAEELRLAASAFKPEELKETRGFRL
jgi:hypothetical protein